MPAKHDFLPKILAMGIKLRSFVLDLTGRDTSHMTCNNTCSPYINVHVTIRRFIIESISDLLHWHTQKHLNTNTHRDTVNCEIIYIYILINLCVCLSIYACWSLRQRSFERALSLHIHLTIQSHILTRLLVQGYREYWYQIQVTSVTGMYIFATSCRLKALNGNRKISNIRHPKPSNWNVSRLGLQVHLRYILKPRVKLRMKM